MNKKISNRLFILAIVAFSLAGCDKISNMVSSASPEMQFLSSMDGHWTDAATGTVDLKAADGKIVGIDSNGSVVIITPTGKYDAENKMIPVKMQAYPSFDATADNVVKLLSSQFVRTGCAGDVGEQQRQKINQHFKFKDAAAAAYIGCMTQFINAQGDAQNIEKLKTDVAPAMASLKQDTIVPNLVLFNSASGSNGVKVAVKKDDGTVIWNLGFVRKLNDDEANQLGSMASTLQQKIADRNAAIDKVSADVVSYVETEFANSAKAGAQGTETPSNSAESATPANDGNAQQQQ